MTEANDPKGEPKGAPSGANKPPSDGAAAGAAPPVKRARVEVLLGFLGVFLLLLIVFRGVLFPFLMAIFVAYLIEPVVAWGARGRTLGVKLSRGPVVLLMYGIVLTGAILLVSCGVGKASATVKTLVGSLNTELSRTAEKARFVLVKDGAPAKAPSAIVFPKGTRVVYDPPAGEHATTGRTGRSGEDPPRAVYRTWYAVRIEEGELGDEVLLEPTKEPIEGTAAGNHLVDVALVDLPPGLDLAIEPMAPAVGLEVFFERNVMAPLASSVEKVTGDPFDPGFLRDAIRAKSKEEGAKIRENVVATGERFVVGLAGSLYMVVLILMLTAFLVIDRNRIAHFFASLPPPHLRPPYHKLMDYVDRGLAGVIRGQLMICCVNGFLTWAGLAIFGIKYAAILAFVAGVFSLIPVFGTIASSVPIVLVALANGGLHDGLVALGWIGLIHLLEANLFNPLIMGRNAEMHPVIIIFALLAGESAFGIWGALLAVPTASILQSCFKFYRHEVEGLPLEEPKLHGKWIRGILAKVASRKSSAAAP